MHAGQFVLNGKKSKTKHATEVGIIKSQIKKCGWKFIETFGYETKYKREQGLKLDKTHANDAVAICCEDNQQIVPNNVVYLKRHVSQGDYQQRTGKHSEKIIPTGKLFGLKKFDLVKTVKGIGIIKGKRSTGYFAISDIFGNSISDSVNAKKFCKRLLARTTTLIQVQEILPSAFLHEAKELVVLPESIMTGVLIIIFFLMFWMVAEMEIYKAESKRRNVILLVISFLILCVILFPLLKNPALP